MRELRNHFPTKRPISQRSNMTPPRLAIPGPHRKATAACGSCRNKVHMVRPQSRTMLLLLHNINPKVTGKKTAVCVNSSRGLWRPFPFQRLLHRTVAGTGPWPVRTLGTFAAARPVTPHRMSIQPGRVPRANAVGPLQRFRCPDQALVALGTLLPARPASRLPHSIQCFS